MSGRRVLRELLRAVDRNITSVSGNPLWRNAVLEHFRQHMGLEDPTRIQQELQKASDYAALLSNIAHHKSLLQEYNIGLDDEERTKRMIKATARRVGFKLPDEEPDEALQQRQQQRRQQAQQQALVQGQQQQQKMNMDLWRREQQPQQPQQQAGAIWQQERSSSSQVPEGWLVDGRSEQQQSQDQQRSAVVS